MEGTSSSSFYKSRLCNVMIFQVLLLLGFIWFLLIGVVVDNQTTTKVMPRLNAQVVLFRRLEVIEGQRPTTSKVHRSLELNFVSKRRVPNGPDPIHNRKAGNSNRPPGRAQRFGEAAVKGRRH